MAKKKNHFTPNPTELDIDTSLREVIEHGDLLFPVGIHFTQHVQYREIMIHKHWHREMEILYIAKNSMIVEIETQSVVANEGDIIIIPSNHLHAAYRYKYEKCSFYAAVFDPFFIASYTNDTIQQTYIKPLLDGTEDIFYHIKKGSLYSEQMELCFKELTNIFNHGVAFELLTKAKLFEFFYYFYLIQPEKIQPSRKKEDILISLRIKKTLLFIEDHYKEPIPLERIASYLGISKEHFCRFFKKHFHVSFSDYLTRYRISHAEQLLIKTEQNILDIALECGFDSGNYFSIVFKKITNETPTSFRRKKSM